MHVIADAGHDVRAQQVVHEVVTGLLVRRIDRHGDHVEPDCSAFFGNRVTDVDAIPGFLGTVFRLQDVAGEADRHADVAVGQVADVLGRVEVADIRPDLHQQGLGLFIVFRVFTVMRQAQVIQRRG
ncbi:hypothetical protein FQZ97_1078860 [compost metagenome]